MKLLFNKAMQLNNVHILILAVIICCFTGCAEIMGIQPQPNIQQENANLKKQVADLEASLKKTKLKIDDLSDELELLNNIVSNKSVQECLEKEVDRLYMRGMQLYLADNFTEAITAWKDLLKVDPEHENAKIYIDRARRKLKGIQKLK
jgi:predicted nuclease with TOPRIM domain